MHRIDTSSRRSRIGIRHSLGPGGRSDEPSTVADGLVALHSSDPATVYLSAAARMQAPSVDAIAHSLYNERTLVRHHAMRRTLWVMTPDVARLAHASSSRALVAPQMRRLVKLIELSGVSSAGAVWIEEAKSELAAAIRHLGPVSTRQLGDMLPQFAVPLHYHGNRVSAHSRILQLLGFEGEIIRTAPNGSWTNSQYLWSTATDWIPDGFGEADPRAAASELADLYLRSFGPATTADVQWWSGWTKTHTMQALDDLGAVEVEIDSGAAWISPSDESGPEHEQAQPWVALLPGLDPTAMGWRDRSWYLDPRYVPSLFDRNGNAGPTVWADGRIVGGWAQHPSGEIRFSVLDDSTQGRVPEIEAAADELASFYGDTRHKVRFPAPIQRALLTD